MRRRSVLCWASVAALSFACTGEEFSTPGASGGAAGDGGGSSASGGKSTQSGGSTNGGATSGGATNGGSTNGGATNGGTTSGGATNGGATSRGGASSAKGGALGSGGATNGGATNGGTGHGGQASGGATTGGKSSFGGATSGGATSGGATSGGATSGGATSSVCPSSPPSPQGSCSSDLVCTYGDHLLARCRDTYKCSGGMWTLSAASCDKLTTCGNGVVSGSKCVTEGEDCRQSDTYCRCTSCSGDVCSTVPTWQCTPPPDGCPSVLPNRGQACTPSKTVCIYGNCNIGNTEVTCPAGVWVWSTGPLCPLSP